jgi:hypothetical protein
LAISFYNLGCQQEHLKSFVESLNSYNIAINLELTKQDPFQIGRKKIHELGAKWDDDINNSDCLL